MDQRRLLCARAGCLRLHSGQRHYLRTGTLGAAGRRWTAGGFSARGFLAVHGYTPGCPPVGRPMETWRCPVEGVDRVSVDFWKGRRVLITGATGMVGSWLTKELLAHRACVVALI